MAKDGSTRLAEIVDLQTPSHAPMTIRFPYTMALAFQALRRTSNTGGKAVERGGTIVADKEGKLHIQNLGGFGGSASSFTPNLLVANKAKFTAVGVFHTHPADPLTQSMNGLSLSGADFAYLLNYKLALMVVQSGPRLFAAVRTKQSPLSINSEKLQNSQIAELYGQVFDNKRTAPQASRIEAQETSTELRLAYYQGRDGLVARVLA